MDEQIVSFPRAGEGFVPSNNVFFNNNLFALNFRKGRNSMATKIL